MKIRELAAALSDLDEALGHYGNISPIFSQALLDEIKVANGSLPNTRAHGSLWQAECAAFLYIATLTSSFTWRAMTKF